MHPERSGSAVDAATLRARLRHVHWIGGGPGAGKSALARRLADRYGWRHYATDDVMRDHAALTTPEAAPHLHAFLAMDMDERWLHRSPATMLETFHWFRGEAFDLIVEDLLRLPPRPCVVAEGLRLLPHLVQPLLAEPGHAVWLLPTPEFRAAAIRMRNSAGLEFLRQTSDSERAGRALAARDELFTRRLAEETASLGLPGIGVGTGVSEDDLVGQVAERFGC